jgi:hypothetical protein
MDEEKLRLTLGKLFDDKVSSFRESFINDALATISLQSTPTKKEDEGIKTRLRSKKEEEPKKEEKEELSPEEQKFEERLVDIKKKTEGKPEDQYYNIKTKRLLKNTTGNKKTHDFEEVNNIRICHKKDEDEELFSSLCGYLKSKQGYKAEKEISVITDTKNLTLPAIHYPAKSLDTNFNQELAEDYERDYSPISLDDRAEKSQLVTYKNTDGPSFNDNDTKLEEGDILTSETIDELTVPPSQPEVSIKEKIQAEFKEALSSIKGYQAGPLQPGKFQGKRKEPFSTTTETRFPINNSTYNSITTHHKPELTRNERMNYLLRRNVPGKTTTN